MAPTGKLMSSIIPQFANLSNTLIRTRRVLSEEVVATTPWCHVGSILDYGLSAVIYGEKLLHAGEEIARRMRDDDVGAIPVRLDGQLVGMVTDRDITCRAVADRGNLGKLTALDVMTKDVASLLA